MRAALPYILAVLASYVVVYLATAFIFLDLDVTRWTQDVRATAVAIGTFLAAPVVLHLAVFREEG